MPVYLMAQIDIHDRDEYKQYEAGFMAVFEQFNGRMLAVDEAPAALEGTWSATRTVLIEFPTEADARAWNDSAAYQAIAKHRWAAADTRSVIVKGFG